MNSKGSYGREAHEGGCRYTTYAKGRYAPRLKKNYARPLTDTKHGELKELWKARIGLDPQAGARTDPKGTKRKKNSYGNKQHQTMSNI